MAPLTLRAAVTLHHPALHLGWCGHLATGARVRCSWTRGYWEINRYASAQPRELPACLAGWLSPLLPIPSLLTIFLPLSLVMAKWRRCSSHFSTPQCTWISCYRIRNASACQGLAGPEADVSVLSTGLHFHQCLDWEAERQQLIKFQRSISLLSWYWLWRSADQRLHWCTVAAHPTPPPHLWISFSTLWHFGVSESNNSTTPILPWLIFWIISTWVYVNLIRSLSDMNTKITFISRTMINVKGITRSPLKSKKCDFFKLIKTSRRSDLFSRTSIYDGVSSLKSLQSDWGQQPLIPSDHVGRMGKIRSP